MNTKKELAYLIGCLAAGFLLGPMIVFFIGQGVLGPYDDGAGLGSFYANFRQALGRGLPSAWIMFLSPYLLVQWLRLAAWPLRRVAPEPGADET